MSDLEEYPHQLRHDRLGRKGHKCAILRNACGLCHIIFEDGFTAVVERTALRRREQGDTPEKLPTRSA